MIDQNRIKQFISQTEATALAAQKRATELEDVVRQKDREVEALHSAMIQREEAAKIAMEKMTVRRLIPINFILVSEHCSSGISGRTSSKPNSSSGRNCGSD